MDRRDTDRHPTRTVVYLCLPDGERRACRAINLSASGVFLKGASMGLRQGQRVELAFAVDFGTVTRLHRRQAVVAHVSEGGTGLMMDAYAVT